MAERKDNTANTGNTTGATNTNTGRTGNENLTDRTGKTSEGKADREPSSDLDRSASKLQSTTDRNITSGGAPASRSNSDKEREAEEDELGTDANAQDRKGGPSAQGKASADGTGGYGSMDSDKGNRGNH